jgi:hypothetical protein
MQIRMLMWPVAGIGEDAAAGLPSGERLLTLRMAGGPSGTYRCDRWAS